MLVMYEKALPQTSQSKVPSHLVSTQKEWVHLKPRILCSNKNVIQLHLCQYICIIYPKTLNPIFSHSLRMVNKIKKIKLQKRRKLCTTIQYHRQLMPKLNLISLLITTDPNFFQNQSG